MTQNDKDHVDLVDDLLAQAAQEEAELPSGLMARVLLDAENMQPKVSAKPQVGILERVVGALGGWPALGGLAAASCAGFWIGFNPPTDLIDPAAVFLLPADLTIYDEAAEISGFGWDLGEG